jgi:hypothetical protein
MAPSRDSIAVGKNKMPIGNHDAPRGGVLLTIQLGTEHVGAKQVDQQLGWLCSVQREDSYRRESLFRYCSHARGASDTGKTTRSRCQFKRAASVEFAEQAGRGGSGGRGNQAHRSRLTTFFLGNNAAQLPMCQDCSRVGCTRNLIPCQFRINRNHQLTGEAGLSA